MPTDTSETFVKKVVTDITQDARRSPKACLQGLLKAIEDGDEFVSDIIIITYASKSASGTGEFKTAAAGPRTWLLPTQLGMFHMALDHTMRVMRGEFDDGD